MRRLNSQLEELKSDLKDRDEEIKSLKEQLDSQNKHPVSNWFVISHKTKFETDLFSNQHQVIYYQFCIEYRESPDNTVFYQHGPQFNRFFLKEIGQIPLFKTVFIRNKHLFPHETQIKQPIFTLNENNWVAKYLSF